MARESDARKRKELIMATIVGLKLLGDGLQDVLDPRLRGVSGAGRRAV